MHTQIELDKGTWRNGFTTSKAAQRYQQRLVLDTVVVLDNQMLMLANRQFAVASSGKCISQLHNNLLWTPIEDHLALEQGRRQRRSLLNRAAAAKALLGCVVFPFRCSSKMDRECPWEGPPGVRQGRRKGRGKRRWVQNSVFASYIYQFSKKACFSSRRDDRQVSHVRTKSMFFLRIDRCMV